MAEESIGDVLKAMRETEPRYRLSQVYWADRLEGATTTALGRVLRDTVGRWREADGSWITDTMLAALRAEIGVDAD